jgi:hypothetical protein
VVIFRFDVSAVWRECNILVGAIAATEGGPWILVGAIAATEGGPWTYGGDFSFRRFGCMERESDVIPCGRFKIVLKLT